MPRVNVVGAARKGQGECGKCAADIPAGAGYQWAKGRYGPRKVRCLKPSCAFRPSELTGSDKLASIYGAQESAEDQLDALTPEDADVATLEGIRDELASEVERVAEEYRESAENIEQGFNGNRVPMCDELEGKADELDSWKDSIEAVDFDEPEEDSDEDARQDWFTEQADKLRDAIGECPL